MTQSTNRILVVDIETLMGEAYIWRMWEEVRNIEMLTKPVTILSWAAKWVGEDYTYFDSVQRNSREDMMQNLWDLMDEAEVVVGWNSNRFDIRLINAEFAQLGMAPPSPYKKLDLQVQVRKHMSFMSNKLDYVAQALGLGRKLEHEGLPLWIKCLDGDRKAWTTMQEYNEQDVILTEKVYDRLLPWLPQVLPPKHGMTCTCGSTHIQERGYAKTVANLYKRYQCQGCGAWLKSIIAEKRDKKGVLRKEPL